MRRTNNLLMRQFCFMAIALLVTAASVSAQAQVSEPRIPASGSPVPVSTLQLSANTPQVPLSARQLDAADFDHLDLGYLNQPLVEDWSTGHVVFSNPGTLAEARRNGKEEHWRRIVSDPRYRMQWMKRYGAALRTPAVAALLHPAGVEEQERAVGDFRKRLGGGNRFRGNGERGSMHGDWTVSLGGLGVSAGTSATALTYNVYPAKYTFAPIGAPNCATDFVVFPVNATAASNQANLIGFTNLYSTTCTSPVPTVLFAYQISGTGGSPIETSPALSLDGTKVAFVESSGPAKFHVLTLGTIGSQGTLAEPVVPSAANGAVDVAISFRGGSGNTTSSVYVDYASDTAYVGDAIGLVHKFNPVFNGTPAEITTGGWPFPEPPTYTQVTSPVFDSVSQRVFIGANNGRLECVDAIAVAGCTPTSSIAVGGAGGTPVFDTPILDTTAGMVFFGGAASGNTYLMQAPRSLASQVNVSMGSSGGTFYRSAFDNEYLTTGTGSMYACGNSATNGSVASLWRISINSGVLQGTGTNVFMLVNSTSNTGMKCTPLTEVVNETSDLLFLGISNNGFSAGTQNCNNTTCIASFVLPASQSASFPSSASATMNGSPLGSNGMSGIIIDNVSTTAGASQVYFGNLQNAAAVQASQSGLQ